MKTNFRTKLTSMLVIITVVLMMATIVFAEGTNYTVGMSLTSSSKLKEGDTVIVKVNLTNINAGDGIDTITAKIDYNEEVFEALTTLDMVAGSNWMPSYSNTSKILSLQKSSKVKTAETVLTITLRVKSTIKVDSTTITLKDIVASGGRIADGGTGDITVNNVSTIISKEKTQEPEQNDTNTVGGQDTITTPNTPNASNNSNKPNTTGTNNMSNKTAKDNTITKTNSLPKAGSNMYGLIVIVIIAIVAVFSYILYRRLKKDVK